MAETPQQESLNWFADKLYLYVIRDTKIRDTKKCLQTKYLANNIVFIFEQWLLKINLKEVHKNQPNHI